MASLSELFLGTSPQTTNIPRFSPQQMTLQQQAMGQAQSLLPQVAGNKFDFAPIAQQARTQFAQQTLPSIAERFTSMGGSAQRSSAFPQILGQAGAGLDQGLAALQQDYGLRQQGLQQNLLSSLLGLGMTPQFDTLYQPSRPGLLESAGGGFLSLLPLLLMGGLGGVGGGLSSLLSLFGGGAQQSNQVGV